MHCFRHLIHHPSSLLTNLVGSRIEVSERDKEKLVLNHVEQRRHSHFQSCKPVLDDVVFYVRYGFTHSFTEREVTVSALYVSLAKYVLK